MQKRFLQMMKKRAQSLRLFSLLVCLGMLLPVAGWGQASQEIQPDESGTYHITNAEELAWVMEKGSDIKKGAFSLEADIDWSNNNWTPLILKVPFYGNNNTIRNLNIVEGTWFELTKRTGFFNTTNANVTITDLTLENASIDIVSDEGERSSIGLLIGQVNGRPTEIRNCHIKGGKITVVTEGNNSYPAYIGGLCSCSGVIQETTIDNCSADVNMTIKVRSNAEEKVQIVACGLVSGELSSVTIKNSYATGKMDVTTDDASASLDEIYLSGFAYKNGNNRIINIANCYSTVDIGIAGSVKLPSDATKKYIGGLLCSAYSDSKSSLENCFYKGEIKASGNMRIGGIAGWWNSDFNLENVFYTGSYTDTEKDPETSTILPPCNNNALGDNPEAKTYTTDEDVLTSMNEWVSKQDKEAGYASWNMNENEEFVPDIEESAEDGTDYEWDQTTNTYTILTQKGLLWFADKVNTGTTFNGQTVVLSPNPENNDWDLSEIEWTPIGYKDPNSVETTNSKPFKGVFDGNFQTVIIKTIAESKVSGFFGYVNDGTIKNLIVNANGLEAVEASGLIVNTIEGGTIDHVKSMGTIQTTQEAVSVGGIAQTAKKSTFENCINEANIIGQHHVGGICTWAENTKFISCYNIGNLKTTSIYRAGICATVLGDSEIKSCAYLEGTAGCAVWAGKDEEGEAKYDFPAHTKEQFANGTVTYLLGKDFGQQINTDKCPVWMKTIPADEQAAYKIYSVTLDYGIDGQENVPIYYNAGTTLPEPGDREGYIFEGWYDQETGGNKVESPLPTDVTSLTYYAHWRKITNSITLVQTTGGTISVDKQTAAKDETVTLTATPDAGYVFKAWQIIPETVMIKENNTFTMPDENVTVTATFEKEEDPEPPVDPDPISYYNIYVEEVCDGAEVTTSKNVVREGGSVNIYVEKDTANYTFDNFKVYIKRSYYGYWEEVKEGMLPGEYLVKNIWTNIYVKAEGAEKKEDPTGIESIEGVKVYTQDGGLYVQTPQREVVVIVSMSGAVVKNEEQVGLKQYHGLQPGIYIVRVGDKAYKIRLH